jgi:hypothetical protein
MRDGLTSDRLMKDNIALDEHPQRGLGLIPRILLFGFIGLVFFVTAALWWRFGEGVFVTSVMNAILACF